MPICLIPSRHQKERPFIPHLKDGGFLARFCKLRSSLQAVLPDKSASSSTRAGEMLMVAPTVEVTMEQTIWEVVGGESK